MDITMFLVLHPTKAVTVVLRGHLRRLPHFPLLMLKLLLKRMAYQAVRLLVLSSVLSLVLPHLVASTFTASRVPSLEAMAPGPDARWFLSKFKYLLNAISSL
jgi:hypothetical protein